MHRHRPPSDAGLLFGSLFVAVAFVGIGILGGQSGTEQMATPTLALGPTAPAPTNSTATPKSCKSELSSITSGEKADCIAGCIYTIDGSKGTIDVTGEPTQNPPKDATAKVICLVPGLGGPNPGGGDSRTGSTYTFQCKKGEPPAAVCSAKTGISGPLKVAGTSPVGQPTNLLPTTPGPKTVVGPPPSYNTQSLQDYYNDGATTPGSTQSSSVNTGCGPLQPGFGCDSRDGIYSISNAQNPTVTAPDPQECALDPGFCESERARINGTGGGSAETPTGTTAQNPPRPQPKPSTYMDCTFEGCFEVTTPGTIQQPTKDFTVTPCATPDSPCDPLQQAQINQKYGPGASTVSAPTITSNTQDFPCTSGGTYLGLGKYSCPQGTLRSVDHNYKPNTGLGAGPDISGSATYHGAPGNAFENYKISSTGEMIPVDSNGVALPKTGVCGNQNLLYYSYLARLYCQ